MKRILRTLLVVVFVLSFTNVVFAEINPTINESTAMYVNKALEEKSLYHYNLALNFIQNEKNEDIRNELLNTLNTIAPEVYSKDLLDVLNMLTQLCSDKSIITYDNIQIKISESKELKDVDKGYLLSEVITWGRKLVFTKDFTDAVDEVGKVEYLPAQVEFNSKTKEEAAIIIKGAQEKVNQVKHEENRKWLQDKIDNIVKYFKDKGIDVK